MASTSITLSLLTVSLILTLSLTLQQPTPPLNSAESDSVYLALHSINPDIPWRTLYPDDLCLSSPHGIVCSYLNDSDSDSDSVSPLIPHITQLNLGYVSDASPNPTCSSRATFPLAALSSLPHLRKLMFYRCFTNITSPVSLPAFDSLFSGSGSEIEEIVFMENPGLTGSIEGYFGNFTWLRRFILTGSNVYGGIPDEITDLPFLEQLTISGNKRLGLGGKKKMMGIPVNIGRMTKLKVLDLSGNKLEGNIPESLGENGNLIKLDLSNNNLIGKIPDSLGNLKMIEFLDLGFNNLGKFGVPIFLGRLVNLKEVYLSGNLLGGVIPEIWENLGGILGIGFSGVGLEGNIPSSMGVYLSNASFILLDNNKLQGSIPKEFESLQKLNEMNLRNNRLSGELPLSLKFVTRVRKLKLEGNFGICIDKSMRWSVEKIGSGGLLTSLDTCNSSTIDENYNPALSRATSSLPIDCSWWLLFILVLGAFW